MLLSYFRTEFDQSTRRIFVHLDPESGRAIQAGRNDFEPAAGTRIFNWIGQSNWLYRDYHGKNLVSGTAIGSGKIQPMIEKYQGLEEDLKQKKFVLSDEALFQKQLDLASMRNEIETKMKELENQLQVDQKRLEAPLTKKLVDVIEGAGKEAGFTIILRRGSPGLLYTREALDITDLIIKKYNQKG